MPAINISNTPSGSGTAFGSISTAGEHDLYTVQLRPHEEYLFEVNTPGSALDSTLTVSGFNLNSFNDDIGFGPEPTDLHLGFHTNVAGTYTIDVAGFGPSTGAYNVVVREVPANTSTYQTVGINFLPEQGDIQDGSDQDWFGVNLTAGQSYIFDAHGIGLSDPTLGLHNSAGTQVAFDDDGGPGLDSRIQFTPTSGGMYFLDAGGFGASTGAYEVSARADDYTDDINTTQSIAPGGGPTGSIVPSTAATDHDFLQILLTAGQHYDFDVVGAGLRDPTLAVRDSAGTQVAFNDDSRGTLNSHIDFTPTTSGAFYLDVAGFGTNTGSYTLFG